MPSSTVIWMPSPTLSRQMVGPVPLHKALRSAHAQQEDVNICMGCMKH